MKAERRDGMDGGTCGKNAEAGELRLRAEHILYTVKGFLLHY